MTTHHPDHAVFLADSVLLMNGPVDVRSGPAAQLLTNPELSRLYAIDIRTLTYQHHGHDHRAVVPRHGDELD